MLKIKLRDSYDAEGVHDTMDVMNGHRGDPKTPHTNSSAVKRREFTAGLEFRRERLQMTDASDSRVGTNGACTQRLAKGEEGQVSESRSSRRAASSPHRQH